MVKKRLKKSKVVRFLYDRLKKYVMLGDLICRNIKWKGMLVREKFCEKQNYPEVIQLPITHKCNFDCIMCGMKKLVSNYDFSPEELAKILQDPLYKKVVSVGINGGEPFIRKDIDSCVEVIIESLPKLKNIYFISNGYLTSIILEKLSRIKQICSKKGVKLNISFSLDGIADLQDFMRGKKDAYNNICNTCNQILKNKEKYCDYINIICTITKHNIDRINEVEVWAEKNNLDVAYNIATINERISNHERYENFSIFTDEHAKYLAAEFFYGKFIETKSQRYYAIYKFIIDGIRYSPCEYQCKGVTLTPNGEMAFCATHSKIIGNAMNNSSENIYFKNGEYLKELKQNYCSGCSHYIYKLSLQGIKEYNKEMRKIIG